MNREEAPGKSPEDMYIQHKVRVLLMLKKMGSNVSMATGPAGWFSHFRCWIRTNGFLFLCHILAFRISLSIRSVFFTFVTFYSQICGDFTSDKQKLVWKENDK